MCVSLRNAYIPSVAVAPYASLQYIAYVWLHNIAVLRRSWLWEPTLCNKTFTVLSMLWSHRQGWWNILAAFVYLVRVCQQMERITRKNHVYFWKLTLFLWNGVHKDQTKHAWKMSVKNAREYTILRAVSHAAVLRVFVGIFHAGKITFM